MWIKTSQHTYASIFIDHGHILVPYSSCTCPDGDPTLGIMKPYIDTEWIFKDADTPILKCTQRKKHREQEKWDYEYFIYKHIGESE